MPTCRAIVVTRHGGRSALAEREISVPLPGPGQVMVETRAIGLNFADVFERMGLYEAAPPPPFVPGFEAAGVVREAGRGVTALAPGDRVSVATRFGGYAGLLTVPQQLCWKLPDHASFEEGAGFPCVYATAYHALFTLGHLAGGMRVLIHAAAGGVGLAALQLARLKQVEVFATAGSDEKLAVALSEGARHAINYSKDDFEPIVRAATAGKGVDLVLDSVGGDGFRKSYRLLAPRGHLVAFGAATMMPSTERPNWLKLAWQFLTRPRLDPLAMIGQNRTVSGFNLVHLFSDEVLTRTTFEELARLWQEGRIKPRVGRTFPFEQAAEAQEALRSRATVGKVVLTLGPVTPAT